MLISKEMYKYLTDYMKWIENGAHDLNPYYCSSGLCFNLEVYTEFNGGFPLERIALCGDLLLESKSLFETEGLNIDFPFGEDNYEIRYFNKTQHLDPIRLEWIKSHIEEYEIFNKENLTNKENQAMKITVVLTSPEQHPTSQMPNVLWNVWYFNRKLLDLIGAVGCPNTGCQHTLTVKGSDKDVISWLDLFLEYYPAILPEINAIKESIKKEVEKRPDIKHLRVVLSQLTRDHDQNGISVNAPWFYRD